jgi:peptidyl-prolyl cis-trans isomerase C
MRRNDFRTAGRDSESSGLTPNGATPQRTSNTRSTLAARVAHAAMRAVKEPLVHFLVLGVALFAANAYLPQSGIAATAPKQIVLTLDELRQLEMVFLSQWRRPPTPQQFDALVETKVKEEILYREAVAIGLDKDDEIVKRRMAQKMQFIAEDVAAAHEPSRTELRTWFTANAEKFALPGRVSFRHLYFSPDQRGGRARDDAVTVLQRLENQPIDSPLAVGDATLLQEYYGDRAAEQLAKDFGPVFAQATFELPPGSWQGPIESGFGWHLLFVDSLVPGRMPEFEEVEPDVETAWLGEQKALAWQKAYAALRAKYVVLLPKPPEDASPGPVQ